MPAKTVPAMFIHKWSLRPRPPCLDEVIRKMQSDGGAYEKQWRRKCLDALGDNVFAQQYS